MTQHRQTDRALRHGWIWVLLAGATLFTVLGVLTALGMFASPPSAPGTTESGRQNPISTAPAQETTSESTAETEPEITIASTRTMTYSPIWNPPDDGESFWQIVDPANGYPESGGTAFIIAHACESRNCTGDQVRLLDLGDALHYRGDAYVVQQKYEVRKNEIADQDIWEHDPDRIVIITCIIDTSWEESEKNEVVVASKARP